MVRSLVSLAQLALFISGRLATKLGNKKDAPKTRSIHISINESSFSVVFAAHIQVRRGIVAADALAEEEKTGKNLARE